MSTSVFSATATDAPDAVSEVFSSEESAGALAQIVRTKFTSLVDVNRQNIGINQRTEKEWLRSKSAENFCIRISQAFLYKIIAFENADELLKESKDYV